MKTDLNTFNNKWYNPGKNPIIRVIWYYTNISLFKSYWLPVSSLKRLILRVFGAKIGARVVIKPNVNIKYPWKLEVGENSWIGEGVWIDNLDNVKIGPNVCISQGALILSGNHDYKKKSFDLIVKPIVIKEGAWVGAKSIVTQGVTIESHAVLSVQSVASKNLAPYTINTGNPAEFVRKREIN